MGAVTGSIQASLGIGLVSSMIIHLQLRLFIYCETSMNIEDTLGLLFRVKRVVNSISDVYGIVLPM